MISRIFYNLDDPMIQVFFFDSKWTAETESVIGLACICWQTKYAEIGKYILAIVKWWKHFNPHILHK